MPPPNFSSLAVMESWEGPGNEATHDLGVFLQLLTDSESEGSSSEESDIEGERSVASLPDHCDQATALDSGIAIS